MERRGHRWTAQGTLSDSWRRRPGNLPELLETPAVALGAEIHAIGGKLGCGSHEELSLHEAWSPPALLHVFRED